MSVKPIDAESSRRLWASYTEVHREFADELPPTERFGDSAEMADELLNEIINGSKRATAGLVAEYAHEGEALARIGDHWIVADSEGTARAVLRSTELRIGRFDSVDAKFAWDEGEGDRSLDWWLDAHRTFFLRACERIGIAVEDPTDLEALEVVFERFTLVWPNSGSTDRS